jgi:hypothetical protein
MAGSSFENAAHADEVENRTAVGKILYDDEHYAGLDAASGGGK